MHSLRELQQRFADALLAAEDAPPPPALTVTTDAFERFAIYRRAVFANYRNALRATYPVVERLVGTPFFNAAVDAYVRAFPSASGDLNLYGDAFGAFLAAYPPAGALSYLPDVARLEWAIDEANRAADVDVAPDRVLAALAAQPADRLPALRLALAPSCRLLATNWPVLRIWRVNQPGHGGDQRVALDGSADCLVVRRDPDGIALEALPAGMFAWLAALAAGQRLAAAIGAAEDADAGFDLGPALHTSIGNGTIVAVLDD